MGGLFVGHYALKYPENIERIVFMSSVGITVTPEFAKPDVINPTLSSGLARYGSDWALRQLNNNFSPFDSYRA